MNINEKLPQEPREEAHKERNLSLKDKVVVMRV